MGKLDPDDVRPPYLQVAEALRGEMETGALKPGEKLPSHAALAEEYDVSVGTVKRVIAHLQTEGVVVSRQGQGAYVRTRPLRRHDGSAATSDELAEMRADLAALADRLAVVERRLDDR